MTLLRSQKPLKRETSVHIFDGGAWLPIMVELHPGFLVLRQKGRRSGYTLAWETAYRHAVRLAVEQARRERRKK